jgi:hypothetical protein
MDREYVKIVADVLGITLTGADAEISTAASNSGEYTNFSEGGALFNDNLAQNYQTAAQKVATQAIAPAKMQALLGSSTAPTAAQVQTFITTKVARLWRRPLTSTEVTKLTNLYNSGVPDGVTNAFSLLLQAALQAPSFLFRTELGNSTAPPAKAFQLTPFELASALSFLFTATAPDDSLWEKAQNGTLTSPSVLAAEVDRLIATPVAQANLSLLVSYWLWTERVPAREKDPGLFPEYTAALKQAIYQSGQAFVKDVVTTGKLSDLFTSTKVYVNKDISTVFGIPGGNGTTLVPVDVSAPERSAGILTQPALLAATNKRPGLVDPVHHGLFVLENLLCGGDVGAIPDPPANAFSIAAMMMGDERELVALRAKTSPCNGCHANFDPFGLTRLTYDSIGRFSATKYVSVDNSVMPPTYSWATSSTPLDSSATVPNNVGPDLAGAIADARALAARVNTDGPNRRVAYCAGRWLSLYAMGHDANLENSCALQAVKENLYKSGSFLQFYRDLATSSGFVTRDPGN